MPVGGGRPPEFDETSNRITGKGGMAVIRAIWSQG
jgi:hypothetical protein